jgi:hypothetical protein
MRSGATAEEIMEAIWVAAEMRAGGSYAHSILALDTIAHHGEAPPPTPQTDERIHERSSAGGRAQEAV